MAPNIPDRWLDYTPVGRKISGTRFIAFKVPLREHVVQSVPSGNRLSCESLLDKIPNLGMIIDLTNTYRHYDPETFVAKGIQYVKLKIPGQTVPGCQYVQEFKSMVNSFLEKNADNDKLIGVHCTHGVNRTGYLISSFMISEMKMTPENAIKYVELARGHVIERENYKNDLKFNHRANNRNSKDSDYHNWRPSGDRPEKTYNDNYRNPFRSRYEETKNVANHENWRLRNTDQDQDNIHNRPSTYWERLSHQKRRDRRQDNFKK